MRDRRGYQTASGFNQTSSVTALGSKGHPFPSHMPLRALRRTSHMYDWPKGSTIYEKGKNPPYPYPLGFPCGKVVNTERQQI